MRQLEALEDFAFAEGVDVLSKASPSSRKGCCMQQDGQSVIFLNELRINGDPDKTCVLAEELGHIQTGALLAWEAYLRPDYARWVKRKNKLYAQRWAIQSILPHERIQEALDGGHVGDYELAEELQVPEDFLRAAFAYYVRQGVTFVFPEA